MKKISVLLCFLLVINIITPYMVQAGHPKHLVAIGDSIPYGYNLKKENKFPPGEAFPFVIGEDANLEVTNLGIPGLTSGEMLQAIRENEVFQNTVKDSDYVVVYIGGNDLLNILKKHKDKGVKGINMDEVGIVVRNLLFNVYSTVMELDKLTDGKILVYNIYNPYPIEGKTLNQPLHYINVQYSSLIELLSHFTEVKLIDAYQAFKGNPDYIIKEDVHPTVEGHKVLANLGLKQIKE
ncbi:SGNH/GDSL hydrolase family protein [Halobacillus seohaensis]|uniref:SGNH/GDSL hydrolase family protein n=1 Tax=Halobacillus seohaensis TaxID=447421 RepID=A0ABW2EF00_9BACI